MHALDIRFWALALCPSDRTVLADILRLKYVFFYDQFNVISYISEVGYIGTSTCLFSSVY